MWVGCFNICQIQYRHKSHMMSSTATVIMRWLWKRREMEKQGDLVLCELGNLKNRKYN